MKCKHVLAPYAQSITAGGSISDLLPSQVSEYISLAYTATLASVTITLPTGGSAPYSVTATLCQDKDGNIISTSAPSSFVRTFPVSQNKSYLLTVELSDSAGQKTYSSYLVSVAKAPSLAWAPPTSVSRPSGSTTATITWNSAIGGVSPYTYSASTLAYDSLGSYSATVSDAGLTSSVSGLANGSTYLFNRTVTDASGSSVTIQAAVVVASAVSSITPGNGPLNQVLAAGTTSAVIGTWSPASGGTAPYTYVLSEPTGNGAVISGSGLGSYSTTGLTNGRTYAFQLEITDSLGAKGYSVVTISIAYAVPSWTIVREIDFTDANWTALNSTDATASTAAPQHILYASDGVTPRAQVWNNTAQARRLRIDPSSTGLALITTNTAATPSIKVIALDASGANVFSTLNFADDLIKVEYIIEGEEPVGTGSFSHLSSFSVSQTNGANQHGFRVINSGSNIQPYRRGWTTTLVDTIDGAAIVPGSSRKYQAQIEIYITGSRTIETYGRYGTSTAPLTDLAAIPRSGRYFFHEAASQVHTTAPVLQAFSSTTSTNGWGIMLYEDGSFIDAGTANLLSRLTLKKMRISRLPNGSKA